MIVLFQNLDFLRIEDLDLHNLAVKKASSLLLMPLDYFYQITCKYIPVVLLLHLKAKGYVFIINMKYRLPAKYGWLILCGGQWNHGKMNRHRGSIAWESIT
jgi:hypothetical protein